MTRVFHGAAALAADGANERAPRSGVERAAAEAVHVPVQLIQADLDPLARTDAHARFIARLGTIDRPWIMVPRSDHAARSRTPRRARSRRSVQAWCGRDLACY
jgi:alpha-beta hydrolase superfamily lysophospholipase